MSCEFPLDQAQPDGQPLIEEKRRSAPPGAGMPARNARYARMPKRIRERYEYFLSQPGYIELRHEIAIHQAQHEELMARLETEDCDEEIKAALEGVIEIQADLRRGANLETVAKNLERLRCELEAKDRKRRNWMDTERVSVLLAKLKETEVKRMVAANQVLTVTESYNLIMRLATFVEDWFCDSSLRQWGWEELRARAVRELHTLLERKNAAGANGSLVRDNARAAVLRACPALPEGGPASAAPLE